MRLKILTWNISYGYGVGSEGTAEYQPLPRSHFESALTSMAELIRNLDVDVVLLQEVDFDASRSHHISQLDFLARTSGLLYRHECVSWNAPYVPYPGLRPARQFGRIKSGGGILSRFPIKSVLNELLPKPKENGALYNLFYLNRYLEIVDVEGIRFTNLHLEAFSGDNRELHLVKLQSRLIDYGIDIAGGDFNGDIPLSKETQTQWQAYPALEPTFPSPQPTEKLDGFVLKKDRFSEVKMERVQSGSVSDHFPLLLTVSLTEARGNARSNSPQV